MFKKFWHELLRTNIFQALPIDFLYKYVDTMRSLAFTNGALTYISLTVSFFFLRIKRCIGFLTKGGKSMPRQTRKVNKESCQVFFKQRSVRKDDYFDRESLQFYNHFYNLLKYLHGDPIVQELPPASRQTTEE